MLQAGKGLPAPSSFADHPWYQTGHTSSYAVRHTNPPQTELARISCCEASCSAGTSTAVCGHLGNTALRCTALYRPSAIKHSRIRQTVMRTSRGFSASGRASTGCRASHPMLWNARPPLGNRQPKARLQMPRYSFCPVTVTRL